VAPPVDLAASWAAWWRDGEGGGCCNGHLDLERREVRSIFLYT
jgi:hypothetical protein